MVKKWLIAGNCFSYFSLFILAGVLIAVVSNMAYLLSHQSYVIQAYLIALFVFLCGVFKLHQVPDLALLFSIASIIAAVYITFRLFAHKPFVNILSLYYPIMIFFAAFIFSYNLRFSMQHKIELSFMLLTLIYLCEYRHFVKLFMIIRNKGHNQEIIP